MFISSAIAQTAPAAIAPSGIGSAFSLESLAMPIVMIGVIYFAMFRPQMKRQKETKAMLDALAKGDEVATAGGIIGTITKINDSIVSIEVATGVEMQIQRFAVAQILPKGTRA